MGTPGKRAAREDPSGIFSSSLDGNTRRAIDFREGEKIDEKALKTLFRAAVTLNQFRAPDLQAGRVGAEPLLSPSRPQGPATPPRQCHPSKKCRTSVSTLFHKRAIVISVRITARGRPGRYRLGSQPRARTSGRRTSARC
jgi:hypothetical protein